ncbi:MAG: hypothetical protein AABP62_17075 [Planctomycetota bacterium]
MSQKRQVKLKKRAEDQHRRDQKRHDLAMSALRHAGVYDAFLRIPKVIQTRCLELVQPAPEVILHESAAQCEQALGLKRELPPFLDKLSAQLCRPISPTDQYCFLWPLKTLLEAVVKDYRKNGSDLEAAPVCHMVALSSQLSDFMGQYHRLVERDFVGTVWGVMLYNSIYDERILWCEFGAQTTPGGRGGLKIVLHRATPERVQIVIDDRPRPAFRCWNLIPTGGFMEISWTGREIGFPGDDRKYPVYMQSHVLEQLNKRVPCSRIIYPLTTSLLTPKFHRADGDHFLLEFRHTTYKLGYFVAVRLQDRILLKTFLFLTMQGTPESDLLYHKLHLTRRDIEYLKLDELAAFRDPEVRNDPVLMNLLKECGCGHLLTLTAADLPQEIPTGYAEPLRKYLGTDDKSFLPMPLPAFSLTPHDLQS